MPKNAEVLKCVVAVDFGEVAIGGNVRECGCEGIVEGRDLLKEVADEVDVSGVPGNVGWWRGCV